MSSPAATAFRWKKCRFDLAGPGARRVYQRVPGKFVSLPDSPPVRFGKGDISKDKAPSVTYRVRLQQSPGRQGLLVTDSLVPPDATSAVDSE